MRNHTCISSNVEHRDITVILYIILSLLSRTNTVLFVTQYSNNMYYYNFDNSYMQIARLLALP
jgi:hypothetical protein